MFMTAFFFFFFLRWDSSSFVPYVLVTRVCFFPPCPPQAEVDAPLSAQEQMIILYDIKLQCQQNLSTADTEVTGK